MSEIAKDIKGSEGEQESQKQGRFLSLLDSEIDSIESQTREPGWTPWALKGAVAAALWLLSKEVGASGVNWTFALSIALLLSMIHDLVVVFSGLLEPEERRSEREGRFQRADFLLGGTRRSIAVALVRYGAFLYVGAWVSPALSPLGSCLIVVWCGLFSFVSLAALVLSFFSLPLPLAKRREPIRDFIIFCLLLALPIMGTLLLGRAVSVSENAGSQSHWRIGGLLACLGVLARFLAKSRSEPAMGRALRRLRRDLLLGVGSIESIKAQFEIAMAGVPVSRVLESPLEKVLEAHAALNRSQDALIQDLEVIERNVPSTPESATTERKALITSVLHSAKANTSQMSSDVQALKDARKRFAARATVLLVISPGSADDMADLSRQIEHGEQGVDRRFKETLDRLERLGVAVEDARALLPDGIDDESD